jgi:hypothetical protein
VELTAENWKEYLSVSSYTKKSVQTDAFDEVVSTEISTVYYLGAKNDQYCNFRNVVIELKDRQSGDLLTYRTSGDDPITVEEFLIWISMNVHESRVRCI